MAIPLPACRLPLALLHGLLLVVALAAAPLLAATQSVVEVVFDGLPAEVTAESLAAGMMQKANATYDKALLPADRERVTATLKDQGFLDADTKTAVNFLPAGVRLTFTVKARNRYTVETVTVEGVAEDVVAAVLAEAKVDKQTPCTQAVVDQLAKLLAPKLGINVLYLEADRKPNANKKEATLVFRR